MQSPSAVAKLAPSVNHEGHDMTTDKAMVRGLFSDRWRPAVWGAAVVLLSLPAIAMKFFPGAGVDWTGSDFAVMGVLLGSCCGLYEIATRVSGNWIYRAAFALAVGAGFLQMWINLAVGIIGPPHEQDNILFPIVLLVGIAAAIIVRFRVQRMAQVLFLTAAAQAAVGVFCLAIASLAGTLCSGFFAALWFASGVMFWKAADE
jgi:hypothetical protein